jgi:hypothetical protein
VQVQNPFEHAPVVPHWAFVEQVPQVPPTHAIPPPHWLFAVQAAHAPLMHASPIGGLGFPSMLWLQSAKAMHAPHTLLMHAFPFSHWLPGNPVSQPCSGAVEQTPF